MVFRASVTGIYNLSVTDQERVDFFVSYNQADRGWAEWIAWTLEEVGYKTVLQAWDFPPGSNFVLAMHRAAQVSGRTIAILSPSYMNSQFGAPEWAAAFAGDPTGAMHSLIPVRIAPSDSDEGLLAQIVWIDLVGLDRAAAKAALLAGLQPGRSKPLVEPVFPGTMAPESALRAPSPGREPSSATSLDWQPLVEPVAVTWRDQIAGRNSYGYVALVELHLVPISSLHLEVRQLGQLSTELANAGRAAGLFSVGQALTISSDAHVAYVASQQTRHEDEAGLAVTRSGQRTAWLALPHDSLGAVFDPEDMRPRLASLLHILRSLPVQTADRTAFALRIRPLTLVSVSSAAQVGHRSSSSMIFAGQEACTVEPEDTISTVSLDANVTDVADELTARLSTSLK